MRTQSKVGIKGNGKRIDVLVAQNDLNRSMKEQIHKSNSTCKVQAIKIVKLSNGMKVFDFNEDMILAKLEKLMALLDEEF